MQNASNINDKRRHNDAAPISRLPTELFAEVIRLTALEWPLDTTHLVRKSRSGAAMRRRLGWIVLTHVCSIWRSRIIRMQSVWAAFVGATPMAMDETLFRAGNHCPIIMHATDSNIADICILNITHRITGIVTGHKISHQSLKDLLDVVHDAPHLETLDITCVPFLASFQEDVQIYAVDAPGLRSLRLKNCLSSCTSNVLTSLDISFKTQNDIRHLYGGILLTLISRCRETLRFIKLCFRSATFNLSVEDFETTKRWPIPPIIILPHVHTLIVEHAVWVLQCLSVPATASTTLRYPFGRGYIDFGPYRSIWSSKARVALHATLPAASRTCAVSISIQTQHIDALASQISQELCFNFYNEPFDASYSAPSRPILSVSLSGEYTSGHSSSPKWLKPVASVLPSALSEFGVSPTIVRFENSPLLHSHQLAEDIIRSFPTIEHLIIVNPHIPHKDLLEAFASAAVDFPEMTCLSLIGEGQARSRRISSIRLSQQLAWLLERSPKLERVSVDRSLASYASGTRHESALEEMRSAVRHFDWDVGH